MTSYLSLFQFGIPSFPILLSINGNKVIATGLLYFLFLASSTGQSPLNGVYTIGGENPDFEKFSDATAALIVDGINGPVTFNVRDGNYNEHILIRNINGSNKDTPVIFQGESGDPSKCQITYDAFNSTGNYVVKLSKVEGVQFKNISLKALDLLRYSDVIVLDSSHHITFENMILESLGDDNRYEKTIVTVSESNNCTIKNNHFIGGCWGISSNSRFGDEPTVSGINIIGNTFQDQALRGIALHGNRNISIITNNFIRANRFSFVDSDYIGIFLYECDNGLRLEKNSMYTNRAGTSLSIESYDGTAEFPAIIANNFLYEGFSGSNEGISVESSTFLYFYYNSVNIKNHREIFSISRGSNNIKLFNNIIYNSRPSGGIPISIEEDALVAADYNNYFSENNNFFVDNKSLRDWQEATSFDAHSYSVDPQFIINNSFAISNPILNNAGLFLADFPKDIDGTLRNSTPDIGADEFSPIMSTDLRVDALTQPSSIFEPGNQEIKVQITNTGNANLTGGTLVWTVNGEVQPTSSWAKVIPEGTRDTLSLGSYNFLDGKPYIIEVISQATNDTITSNDTLLVDNIFSGISGVYTIGEGADFPNFQTATNALQFGGVLGEVTFNVLDGVYEEAILLKEIKYKEVNHPITFQSASGERSGVIVQHSATALVDNYVLSLYDEQNITFQNMTLQALGNEYSNVISLGNDVANITFENLVIENTSDSLVDGSNANTLLSISSFSQNIQIKNNLFKNGVYGVSYETIYRSRRLSGIVLSGNTFVDQRDRSVFLTQIDDLIIRKNTFDSKYETYRPIYLFDSAEGLELIQNKINSMGVYGIFLSSCLGNAASPGLIANNFVNINSEKVPSGIILDNSSNLNVYHNSVVVKSGDIDYHQAAFKLDESTDIQMANNIFAYKGNMGAIYSFESTFSSDYNALFSNALIAVKGVQPSFGKVNPLGYSTLEKWQEETQTETNSFVILPEFISETDLHTFDLNLNSAGIGNLGIFEDIDGETRDLPFPDIGADEFSIETTECPTQDVLLRNQSDIDNFVSNHSTCDSLPASLTIQGSEVLDISSLAFLKYIGQNLTIANTKLDDLTGLSEIIFIGGAIKITNNDSLSSLSGLPNVTTIFGDLDISNNHNLTDCNAICLLIHNDAIVGSINIANNPTPCGNISEVRLFCVPIGCTNGPDVVANMLPANGAAGLTSPVSFSWIPVENAFQYFFKIWKEGEEIPILPIKITDQNTVNYEIAPSTTYHWQVFSVNPNCSTVSPIQSFTTAPFNISDLIIPDVEVPLNPFSGQSIELSWEVKNQGSASTNIAGWYDYVYLSKDSIFQPNIDELLGASSSPVVLEVNENTTQRLQTTLPEGIDGTHYIFVVTDKTKFINEAIESNNVSAPYPMRLTLTPPPDLLVSDIITPGTAFAGSEVNVTWSVVNDGTGDDVQPFTDHIYFSDQPTFDPSVATLLKAVIQTPLAKGDTIIQTTQITLPVNIFGPHFLHIRTDAKDEVFEFAGEDNNYSSSDTIEVIVNPPADLIVSDIRAKEEVSNRERVLVEWTAKNIGATTTANSIDHQIYLSSFPNFDKETALELSVSRSTQAIQPGASLAISSTIEIPDNLTGAYYLFVETDFNNRIFELENEDNNLSEAAPITVQNADLIIVNLAAAPIPGRSGETIKLSWTTVNQGMGDAINTTIFDRIFIDTDASLLETANVIGSTTYQNILAGDSLHLEATVRLPYGLEGEYYIHLLADATESIFENDANQNNSTALLIPVQLPPWPDLQIASLTGLPTNALAGSTLQLAYTVKNNGLGAVTGDSSWVDKIFISDQTTWDFSKSKLITEVVVNRPLGIDSSYTNEVNFVLPMLANDAPTGVCYIYVYTDFNQPDFPTVEQPYQNIYEHTDENNNTQNHRLLVTAPDPVDFSLLNASTLPDTLKSGKEISIGWEVQNIGNSTALWGDAYPLWYDGFYLSRDSVWSSDDIFVKDFTQQGPIDSLESYTKRANFKIPDNASGNYYLILVADHTNLTNDKNDANDSWIIQPNSATGVTAKPIYIELSPTADLVLSELNAPTNGISGQAIQVIWEVKNEGMVLPPNAWTDKIYLSTDFVVDAEDLIIGTKVQHRAIAIGETYLDSMEVFIPISAEGNYVLIVKTDANNELFEVDGEGNNQANQPLTTELPLPADLVVSEISSANMVVVGQPFTINYTLENQGVNPAKGQFRDLVYLSKDSLLDATDLPITEPILRKEDMVPFATVSYELTATVPGVSTGNYYLLVNTDIQNNIHEINEGNNLGMTLYKLEVTVPELIMNQPTSATLTDNTNIYYRIDIPQNLVNETMRVSLDALANEGFNELYLRYGDIPSRAAHDYSFSNAFSSDQAIVVPELVAGTYYVLAYGNSQTVEAMQEISLLAEIVPFQLTKVMQNKGGNSGPVTVKLEGSKFEPNMTVELKMGENTISGLYLEYINSTEAYITFNLGAGEVINTWLREGVATGFYDVIIEKENGATTTLENGFEVIEGSPSNLKIDLVYPENVRVQRVVPMTINFTNNGSDNIRVPTYSVLSLRGAPIALSVAELKEEYKSVVFQLRETDGPTDVLRPGAVGSITIYAYSSQALTFKLVEVK